MTEAPDRLPLSAPSRLAARSLALALATGALLAPALRAQLDATCTVSMFNRTAAVRADGSWRIDNLPANLGPVRARATCVEDGVTRSGQSDFVDLTANIVNGFPADIVLGQVDPIPQSLTVTPSPAVLTTAGETSQLAVSALFPDGSSEDVTGAEGTTYAVSSPAIASLGPGGLLTAVASGTVVVSVTREGALGVATVLVRLGGDSDGDGIPDDLELAVGLDPNNPADAFDDLDGDGLSNLDELTRFGTDIARADSDGDGLSDGDEVRRVGTNPLLFDTDGDGISDGLELQSGSDPLDPASFRLAGILRSIAVSPDAFTLVFNTVVGEASRRLSVTGTLIDGSTLDLRPRSRGTDYRSSDLSVASFGGEDGRIFAGQNGTATITVENSGVTATAEVQVESFDPVALSFLRIPGFANGVAVQGDLAYVAAGGTGLFVVDVSNLTAPAILGSLDTVGNADDVAVEGSLAYVADGPAGVAIVDVSDPLAPALLAQVDTPGQATDLVVRSGRLFVADGGAGLAVIDATDPAAPRLVGSLDTPGNARGIDEVDGLAVIADDFGGVHVVDVSDPSAPVLLGSTHTRPNAVSRAAAVAVRGRLAYVADGARSSLGGLRLIDFRVPQAPVVVGTTSDAFGLVSVALEDGFALTADYFFVNAVPIFDIGGTPQFSAVLDFSRAPSFRDDNGNDVAVRNGAVFLAAARSVIQDNGVFGDTGLHIGRYRAEVDDAGIAPTVAIVEPADGTAVHERNRLHVVAEATDDVRVAAVRFFVDGAPVETDFKKPFETTVTVPSGVSTLRLGAEARDLAGNRGSAEEVVLTVLPDARPTVELLSPAPGSRFVEGVTIPLVADATDDVGVASVEFRVNGAPAGIRTAPPYAVDFRIPVGATELSVEAIATDTAGQVAVTGPVLVGVDDDLPPQVSLLQPRDGEEVVAGSRVRVIAGASDDVQVVRVRFLVDGALLGEDFQPPFESELVGPAVGATRTVSAIAEDNLGQQARADIVIHGVPDPGTTVVGRVLLPDRQPAAGAQVFVGSLSATADAEGRFTLEGVPTIAGDLVVRASLPVPSGFLVGSSVPGVPVPGGTTDVGEIVLFPGFPNGNGGFETGDLTGFTASGEARVVSSLGVIQPPEGSFMGFLSTGGAAVGGTTSTITTTPFTVPAGVNFLTFDVNFLSNEFPSFVGSIFNDTLVARIATAQGTIEQVLGSVNGSSFVAAPGTGFNGMTGFAPARLDVSAFAGASAPCSVTFEIRVFDQGDTVVDSAALIDNLRFE